MPALYIQLRGDFRFVYGGALVTAAVQVRLQTLVAYVLLYRIAPRPSQLLYSFSVSLIRNPQHILIRTFYGRAKDADISCPALRP
jgi:hypothetical protein